MYLNPLTLLALAAALALAGCGKKDDPINQAAKAPATPAASAAGAASPASPASPTTICEARQLASTKIMPTEITARVGDTIRINLTNHLPESTALHFHGISVEGAEALAEYWHKRMRQQLGIAHEDAVEIDDLFKQKYQGSRYSFGYPACPRLEDHVPLFRLLQPERLGVTLSEEFQIVPEQSTSALICHHPSAKYFTI